MDVSSINWLAVLVAGLASFMLGMLWYNAKVFGAAWQQATGVTDEQAKSGNMLLTFGSSLVLMLIMCFGLAFILSVHKSSDVTWMTGLKYGAFIGVVFVSTSIGINQLYQMKPLKLFLIDAGYQLVYLMIAGVIIGAWR